MSGFGWADVRRLFDVDAAVHWQRCEALGLACPPEVFTQLFHDQANDEDFAVIVGGVDWRAVRWELAELSGIAFRHMHVDRRFRLALDEARDHAVCYGIVDEREEVEAHWRDAKSWLLAPVAVSADLLGGDYGFQLLVGCTRLGNLLGMLDRQEIKEYAKHLVWIGRASLSPLCHKDVATDDSPQGESESRL